VFEILTRGGERGLKRLESIGIVPPEGTSGNAFKQGAVEAWIPLVDTLLQAMVQHVPAPRPLGPSPRFYAAKSLHSTDGRTYLAFGRAISSSRAEVVDLEAIEASGGACWFLNGSNAVLLPSSFSYLGGALIGMSVESSQTIPTLMK